MSISVDLMELRPRKSELQGFSMLPGTTDMDHEPETDLTDFDLSPEHAPPRNLEKKLSSHSLASKTSKKSNHSTSSRLKHGNSSQGLKTSSQRSIVKTGVAGVAIDAGPLDVKGLISERMERSGTEALERREACRTAGLANKRADRRAATRKSMMARQADMEAGTGSMGSDGTGSYETTDSHTLPGQTREFDNILADSKAATGSSSMEMKNLKSNARNSANGAAHSRSSGVESQNSAKSSGTLSAWQKSKAALKVMKITSNMKSVVQTVSSGDRLKRGDSTVSTASAQEVNVIASVAKAMHMDENMVAVLSRKSTTDSIEEHPRDSTLDPVPEQSPTFMAEVRQQGFEQMKRVASQVWKQRDLPHEFRTHGNALDVICPSLYPPELEHGFLAQELEEFASENVRGSRSAILAMIVVTCFSVIACSTKDMVDLMPLQYISLPIPLLLLMSLWVFIYTRSADNASRRRIVQRIRRLQFVSAVFVFYVICWQCMTSINDGIDASTRLIRIIVVLMAWSSLPQPVPLKIVLVTIHFAVCLWGLMVAWKESMHPWFVAERMCYLYTFSCLFFLLARQRALETRMSYMSRLVSGEVAKGNEQEKMKMAEKLEWMERDGEEVLRSMMEAHKNRLNVLKGDLENCEAKSMIRKLHHDLVRDYVTIARLDFANESELKDRTAKLVESFQELRHFSEVESERLAVIMKEVYEHFALLPDWNSVREIPAFDAFRRDDHHPQEKIHQKSVCDWWQKKTDALPEQLEHEVGMMMEPIAWYGQRAQWARGCFVRHLKNAIKKFNVAVCAKDLGLEPESIERMWNRSNKTQQIAGLNWDLDSMLESDLLKMSGTMTHEYLVHGPNAGLQIGPIKEAFRVKAKVEEYGEEGDLKKYPDNKCLAKYVCDWLRARVIFANPTAMSLFFWYIMYKVPELTVVACKNKLLKPPEGDTSCNIHLNVCFEVQNEEHTAEIQLLLENFLIAKDLEHKYYEFRRAKKVMEILNPVLEELDPVDEEDEEDIEEVKPTCDRTDEIESSNVEV